jgi:hypothetical protein
MIAGMLGASLANAGGAAEWPFSLTVRAGGFDERCLRLQVDEAIVCDFAADGAVEFNVQYHRDREIFYPVRQSDVRSVEPMLFVASATDDYCLMWENRGRTPGRIDGCVARSRRSAPRSFSAPEVRQAGPRTYLKIPNARVARRSGRMQGGARRTVALATAKRANAADARFSGQPFGAGPYGVQGVVTARVLAAGNGPLAAPSPARHTTPPRASEILR